MSQSLVRGRHRCASLAPTASAAERDPVQDQVRRAGQQRLILLAGRLALHAVRDDDGRAPLRGDRAHLDPGRESCAAAAGQPGSGDLVDEAMPPRR